MSKQSPIPDGEQGRATTAGMPRWVKVSGIITAVLVALVVVMVLVGGHGPGRHMHGGLDRPGPVPGGTGQGA